MTDLWKQCEGQLVDSQFPLLQFLAHTNHSAVFLTNLHVPGFGKAAIKFISADIPAPDQQLAHWGRAEQLAHPHLLKLFHHGRCRIAGMDLLYVVMEHGDENLGQFLPQRALTPEEAREMLNPLVDALVYLHRKGLAHSHIKPSNLLAIADQLKLSCDTALPIGDSRESYRDHDIYDAPENSALATIVASCAADVWSLGITVIESLTQQAPPLPFDDAADPALPDTLPQPYFDIARHSLLRDPARRWTASDIVAHLNPVPVAAAAAASASTPAPVPTPSLGPGPVPATTARAVAPAPVSPLSVPLSPEPAVPLAKLSVPSVRPPRREIASPVETTVALPSYLIPVVLGVALVLGAVFALPKIFRQLPGSSVSTASTAVPSSSKPTPADSPKPITPAGSTKPPTPTQNLMKSPKEPKSSAAQVRSAEATPAPAILRSNSAEPSISTKTSVGSPDRGEVLDQVLPQASPKALATIQGTIHVIVRVQVDPAGNVSSAEFDSPGPSKYFADLALHAAQRWQFASPVSDGHSLPSQWLIRFEFTQAGATAIPSQNLL